jgi:O-antigen/teichoic acid export membrane protein
MVLLSYRLLPTLHLVWRLGWKVYQHILSFSSQIFILRINAVVYNQMDKAIIGALLISTLLTDYDIANKIQSLVLASLTLTSSLMVPAASQLDAIQDETQLQELFVKGTKYTIALCLPAAIFTLVFAEAIIRYWIGPDYVHDAGITRLYLVYLFYLPITVVGYNMMIGMNRVQPLIRTQIATTLVNLAVSVVLVNSVGMAGVIWGTLIGNALTLYPYLRHFLTTLKVPWARFWNESLRPTYSVALLFALLLYAVVRRQAIGSLTELAALGSGGLVVYGGLFFALGLGSAERRALLTAILRNLSWS